MPCCQPNSTSKASPQVGKSGKNYTSALTLLLLALPKCPICVVAYSGAITMCGVSTLTTTTFNQYYDARIYLALVFSTIFIIYLVRSYFNKRHRIFPLLAASSGFLFLVIQSLLEGSAYYYIGGGLSLVATLFLRSPLRNFISKIFSRLQSKPAFSSR
jgi:hypothetical protein